MPTLTVQKQVQLPWGKSLWMACQSIRVEFRRSVLTGLSIVLALAFLNFVWADAHVLDALRRVARGDEELAERLAMAGRMEVRPAEVQRNRLLVVMSLIVCTVGIGNAMMMSVTERFRQIGTMKCLGALDSFIVRLFVLEALMFGLAGALVGTALGTSLAVIKAVVGFGAPTLPGLPWASLGFSAAVTILVGLGICLAGVLYPAIAAARMQPVEAMRVTS